MKLTSLFSIILSCIIPLTACTASSKTNNAPDRQKATDVKKINLKDFEIEVDRAVPMRGKSTHLSYGYSLKIKGDSAFAYLPYYGVASSVPYGGGEGGIKFKQTMEKHQVNATRKKDGWEIKFNATTPDFHYQVFISIFENGSSSINVSSYERDNIWFYGSLKEKKE